MSHSLDKMSKHSVMIKTSLLNSRPGQHLSEDYFIAFLFSSDDVPLFHLSINIVSDVSP